MFRRRYVVEFVLPCLKSFSEVDSSFYERFELLFVNDGSKDNTVEVIEDFLKTSALNARVITKKMVDMGQQLIVEFKKLKENIT